MRVPDCAFRPSRRPPTLRHLAKFGSLERPPPLRSNVSVPRDLQVHGTHSRSVFRGFAATVARFAVPPPSELPCSPRAVLQLPTVLARHTSSRRPCGEAGATHPRLRRQAIVRYPAMDGRVATLRGWPDSLTPVFHRRVWRYSTVEPQDERCRRWRSCAASYAPVKPGASEASASLCRRMARPGAALRLSATRPRFAGRIASRGRPGPAFRRLRPPHGRTMCRCQGGHTPIRVGQTAVRFVIVSRARRAARSRPVRPVCPTPPGPHTAWVSRPVTAAQCRYAFREHRSVFKSAVRRHNGLRSSTDREAESCRHPRPWLDSLTVCLTPDRVSRIFRPLNAPPRRPCTQGRQATLPSLRTQQAFSVAQSAAQALFRHFRVFPGCQPLAAVWA